MPVCDTCGSQLYGAGAFAERCPVCGPVEPEKLDAPSILEEALRVSGENRQRDYGHPLVNHERIAAVWNVVLGPKLTAPVTPREVVLCMIGLKIAREVNTPKRDSLVDICGYVNCLDLMKEPAYASS